MELLEFLWAGIKKLLGFEVEDEEPESFEAVKRQLSAAIGIGVIIVVLSLALFFMFVDVADP